MTGSASTENNYNIIYNKTAAFGEVNVTSDPAPVVTKTTTIPATVNPAIVGEEINATDHLNSFNQVDQNGDVTQNPNLKILVGSANCVLDKDNDVKCNIDE
jgi:hypothetical protein